MRNMFIIIILYSIIILFNCDIYDKPADSDTNDKTGYIVTNIPTEIVPISEINNFQRNTPLKIRLNRFGFTVREYNVILEYSNGSSIMIRKLDNITIGAGDSGSPVLTKDGRLVGALWAAYYYNGDQYIARAMETVMAMDDRNSRGIAENNRFLENPYVELPVVVTSTGIHASFFKRFSGPYANALVEFMHIQEGIKNVPLTMDVKQNLRSINDLNIIPGMSICILNMESEDFGPIFSAGTISSIAGNNYYAYAHSYGDNYFDTSLYGMPAYLGYLGIMVESLYMPRKKTYKTDRKLGVLDIDDNSGIRVSDQNSEKSFSVTVKVTVDSIASKEYELTVYNDPDIRHEYMVARLAGMIPIDHELDSRDYAGTATGSMIMEFSGATLNITIDCQDYQSIAKAINTLILEQFYDADEKLLRGDHFKSFDINVYITTG